MAVRTRAELDTAIAAFTTGGMNTALEFRNFATDLLDTLAFRTAITNAAIKTGYEANANTNAFTDALLTKLNDIEADATADQTGAEIRDLLDTLFGNTNWRTGGGGGMADGVLDGVTYNANGTVDFSINGGTDVQGDLSAVVALLSGATFTGAVEGIAPTADEHLTRKDYVDTEVATRASQTDLDALTARVAALEGAVDTDDHIRYFGWSADRVVETADFAAAAQSMSNDGTLPAHTSNDYIWFAVPESEGAPSALHLAGGQIDQLGNFDQLNDTVDDEMGTAHLIFVSQRQQLAVAYAGQSISLIY